MTELYKTLSRLKKIKPDVYANIQGGDLIRLDDKLDNNVIAFLREAGSQLVLACFNLSGDEKTIEINLEDFAGDYTDAFSGKVKSLAAKTTIKLPPYGNAIFSKN
ncbi:MAG: alpha-glucosidase C-terminal domain-containing protein [Ignavibacteriales bacterium]|jgi:glycosidase|nr:MAG: hypothetical protein F9K26_11070 [Ignavibacteriaceae bacterium]MBW7873842.1 alpha-glucosidase C-terminal domain-containing protein [Ignavibacteria bacterium]MCZ2144179.1 alpha-glucosidase C-terminal domain-containing protein [Ignavibacteriales bacterium]OQY74876.1 MAG: hypothetical protein B6D45_06220 [Ignavibacteriales bacterium UTCHB3]MBV6445818.1 hypothetical protein [Ignavibacteriaceae bacterium]